MSKCNIVVFVFYVDDTLEIGKEGLGWKSILIWYDDADALMPYYYSCTSNTDLTVYCNFDCPSRFDGKWIICNFQITSR